MPPIITKDGVTVFRSLGFPDPTAQVLMEAARDASIRTASEAGDGTTTATILAEAFVRQTQAYCNENKQVSPQLVVRTLQKYFKDIVEPTIDSLLIKSDPSTELGKQQLHAVARISANGDVALADAVMQCFDIIGDSGNVTIVEATGPSKYLVEKIEGYPVPVGFEDCCGPFYQKFVNDPGSQRTILDKPSFVLYHGRINDFNDLAQVLDQIAMATSNNQSIDGHRVTHNVVVAATGFSETTLAHMAAGFVMEGALNVFPLLVPLSPIKTGQYDVLMDLAAMSGATIMDPLENPFANFSLTHLGIGPREFEATRFRSTIVGYRDELLVFERVDQIEKQLTTVAASDLDRALLRERLAKLTSGIAKLVVQGSSNGEIKERRDRAEDAVCAVRGAIKYGALPGGGAVLSALAAKLAVMDAEPIARKVMAPALMEPVHRLYLNAGFSATQAKEMGIKVSPDNVYDILKGEWVKPIEAGVLDSAPAVREAIRNSISIASLLGTCGGTVVFMRDGELERQEARSTAAFVRDATNPANERG